MLLYTCFRLSQRALSFYDKQRITTLQILERSEPIRRPTGYPRASYRQKRRTSDTASSNPPAHSTSSSRWYHGCCRHRSCYSGSRRRAIISSHSTELQKQTLPFFFIFPLHQRHYKYLNAANRITIRAAVGTYVGTRAVKTQTRGGRSTNTARPVKSVRTTITADPIGAEPNPGGGQ